MLIPILIAVAAIIVIFLIVVATRPAEFRIVRSAIIGAPAPVVFALVNDFHNWREWSPWAKRDPEMKETYEGASTGRGAIYSWLGNKQVGQGKMTIVESRPGELIRIRLEFITPFAATNTAQFSFRPDGDQTAVEWDMVGRNNFIAKAFCMFMNMDKMAGADFEKGLSQMKALAEAGTQVAH